MKRLLLLILVLTLAVSNALAAEIDLSAMTEEELIELRARIDELLGDSGDMIYEGTYVVGTDIKAGRYQLSGFSANLGDCAAIVLYDKNAECLAYHTVYLGHPIYLNLEDGMSFDIQYSTCSIQPVSSNWAP